LQVKQEVLSEPEAETPKKKKKRKRDIEEASSESEAAIKIKEEVMTPPKKSRKSQKGSV
jgi:hypothetical protein